MKPEAESAMIGYLFMGCLASGAAAGAFALAIGFFLAAFGIKLQGF